MRRGDFLLALASSRLILMITEVRSLLGFGVLAFHMRVVGSWAAIMLVMRLGALSFAGAWPADRQPRAEDRNRQRDHERGDDANVDFFRHLLFL